ncbi:MAG: Lrp/AsnC family transcriptional regulator [Alteromonadaceae bacterium]|nr:Lrp/AsnC family transcriptional regulator [Alteromonadaceae bacterium]
MEKLDAFDISILRQLQIDASQTAAMIGEYIGLSASQCHRRIKRLETSGFIQKYTAQLDPVRFNLKLNAIVMVRVHQDTPAAKREFQRFVQDNDKVQECWTVVGDKYAMLRVLAKDMESFSYFISHELMALKNIAASESILMMEQLKGPSLMPID